MNHGPLGNVLVPLTATPLRTFDRRDFLNLAPNKYVLRDLEITRFSYGDDDLQARVIHVSFPFAATVSLPVITRLPCLEDQLSGRSFRTNDDGLPRDSLWSRVRLLIQKTLN